jgi:hypothetical protein
MEYFCKWCVDREQKSPTILGNIVDHRSGTCFCYFLRPISPFFHYRLLTDIGLCVKLPMVLEIDNNGAKDLICNWSAGGRIRHVKIRQYFLRDLKEDNLVKVMWIPTLENSTDLFTKNLYGPLLEKHIRIYVGSDVYMTNDNVDCNGWSLVTKKGKQKDKKKNSHIRGKHKQAKGNLVAGFDPKRA